MICQDALRLISAFQDGELSEAQRSQVEAHLKECPACMAAYKTNVALSESIRSEMPTYGVSPSFYERLPRRSRGAAPRLVWGLPVALAALLALVWFLPLRANRGFTQDLVSDHVRSLMAAHLYDVASSDRHTVKPWFLGKLDFAPRVPELKASGFPLLGGRLDYVDGHAAAALVYGKGKHVINVLVLPLGGRPLSSASLDGYQIESWREGDLGYWAVSDVSADDLRAFAAAFKSTP